MVVSSRGTQVQRYLTPKMLQKACEAGIDLCLIDATRPLAEQGHFDAIIHKMRPNKGAFCCALLTRFLLLLVSIPALLIRLVVIKQEKVNAFTLSWHVGLRVLLIVPLLLSFTQIGSGTCWAMCASARM